MIRILVAEDDEKLNFIVCSILNDNGYQAISCKNGEEAVEILLEMTVDMVISDIMMPGMDGYSLAAHVRNHDGQMPILFMTAKDDMPSKQKGYRLGIDDYMVKPVQMDELILRIEALLRRSNIASKKRLQAGSMMLNEEETSCTIHGEEVTLTVREFNILFKLLSYPKRTFTRMQLMDEFWGFETESNPRTVDVSITKLRDKISECSEVEILTVRGLGYKAIVRGGEDCI